MAALRSPLNTPKMLTTPGIGKDEMLSTPTLTTPRTADWGGIFSPVRLTSAANSPGGAHRASDIREPPADLPLDSSIGLSSPQDGVLAKRRKMKQQNSGARSIESDSNSCDTPDCIPRDLTTHSSHSASGHHSSGGGLERAEDNRPTDLSTTKRPRTISPEPAHSGGGSDHLLRDRIIANGGPDLDHVRDRVNAVNLSSPKQHWQFRLPRDRLSELRPPPIHSKEAAMNGGDLIHPSPHLPSPNWSTINDIIKSDNLKTPKVLDNFVFDNILPPHPTTPKIRDLSPLGGGGGGSVSSNPGESLGGSHVPQHPPPFDRHHQPGGFYDRVVAAAALQRPRQEQRVTFGGTTLHGGETPPPPSHNLTPPPPYPQDLSLRGKQEERVRGLPESHLHQEDRGLRLPESHHHQDDRLSHQHQLRHKSLDDMYSRGQSPNLIIPKQELDDTRPNSASPCTRAQSASPALVNGRGEIKEEPREYTNIPPGFPPYYLPGVNPGPLYGGRGGHPGHEEALRHPSPPDSPPCGVPPALQHLYHQAAQRAPFYSNFQMRQQAALLYEQQQAAAGYSWNHAASQPHPGQPSWTDHTPVSNSSYLKLPMKMESPRQSTDSPDNIKGQHRMSKDDEHGLDHDKDGPPPKKRGKAAGAGAAGAPGAAGAGAKGKASKDPNAPKRVFVCPHCQRSYDWNYNLNRHLKYECGKENSFMCSKCGRRFPHKQNCVYHLKRKHKIMCETVDQYVASGLVVFSGGSGSSGKPATSGSEGSSQNSPPLPSSQVYSPPQGEHSDLSNGAH